MSRTTARAPQLLQRAATVTLNPRIPLWGSHLFSLPHALLAVYHARRREAKPLLESGMQDNKHASGLAGARRGRSESDGLSCGRRGAASVLRTGRRLSHADPWLGFEVWAVSSGEGTNEGHANTVIIITPAERSRLASAHCGETGQRVCDIWSVDSRVVYGGGQVVTSFNEQWMLQRKSPFPLAKDLCN